MDYPALLLTQRQQTVRESASAWKHPFPSSYLIGHLLHLVDQNENVLQLIYDTGANRKRGRRGLNREELL